VMQVTDGLFMREVEKVALEHPNVTLREIDIDAIAAELYLKPSAFDVIVTTNMFGDILSNQVNALAGSLGLASALNIGDGHAAANAGHGSAPDIAGRGIANPSGLILSAALLLRQFGTRPNGEAFTKAANAIEHSMDLALERVETRTGDLGGKLNTSEFAKIVSSRLRDE
jgi:isocitrate/isopropylmalate dehydrogenase